MPDLEYSVENGVGTILLNRPEKKNAFNHADARRVGGDAGRGPHRRKRDGGAYYLPRLVGTAKALELLLTEDFVDAEEAHRIGMVERVYDDGDLMQETRELAERLAAGPPPITRMTKRAVCQSARSDLRTSLDSISSHMGIVQSMQESHEAFDAFREKRAPRFESR